jgi:hypothetical protein
MLPVMLALALASPGDRNTATVDPESTMEISDLHLSTENAGACAFDSPIPVSDAKVAVQFRIKNRRDDDFTINVYLDDEGGQGVIPLGTATFNPTGFAPITWTLSYLSSVEAKGVFTNVGYVEDGLVAPITSRWTFRVELVENATGLVLQSLRAPWSKTYGTCA